MTGGFLKVVGLLLVVVGILALLLGLAAAAYGFVDENGNQDQLLPDPEHSDTNEALVLYGLVGAAGGLVLVIVGIIVAVAGGSISRRDAGAPSSEPARPAGRGAWIAGAAIAVTLVLAFVASGVLGGSGQRLSSLGGGDQPGAAQNGLLDEAVFDGQVRNGYATPIQSGTTDSSQSMRTFPAPMGTVRVDVELTWTPQEQGTADLRLILEVQEGDAWRELDRTAGPGPLGLSLEDSGISGATLRYRVFANDDARLVVEQDFQLTVRFYGTR